MQSAPRSSHVLVGQVEDGDVPVQELEVVIPLLAHTLINAQLLMSKIVVPALRSSSGRRSGRPKGNGKLMMPKMMVLKLRINGRRSGRLKVNGRSRTKGTTNRLNEKISQVSMTARLHKNIDSSGG